MDKKAGKK